MSRPDELIDAIYAERVERAKRMDPAQKAMERARLFDHGCRITMDGIRAQFPDADDAEAIRILRERLAMRRAREDHARRRYNGGSVKPTRELLKRIQMDKVNQASCMRLFDRLFAGPRLHDIARERMRLGLKLTHPDVTSEEAERIIRERFDRQRERDDQPWTP